MYRVSVIIPAYNRSQYIEKTIRSVLTQTYQNFEIIVVDDCSNDNTSEIIASMDKYDKRICYIKHDKNKGAQAARNTGVKASNGDFIAFLDSDDEWYPDKLQKQVVAFANLPKSVGVVHGGCDKYFEATGKKRRFMIPKMSGAVYKSLLQIPGPVYPCLMVRRECFEKIPDAIDPSVPAYQEWDTSINLAREYDFNFIDEPLMVYNIYKGETISNDSIKDIKGYLYVVEKHRDEILKYGGRKVLGNHYCSIAIKYRLNMKDDSQSRKFFNMAKEYGVKYPGIRTFMHVIAQHITNMDPGLTYRLQSLYRAIF